MAYFFPLLLLPVKRHHHTLFYVLFSCITLLWGINWWANRSVFMDEANVARNLFELGFTDLFIAPLRYEQYAPPVYLTVTKALGELLGYGERILRLPALASGLMAVGVLWRCGKAQGLGYCALLPIALAWANPTLLRYVGEVKPYATDLLWAALILWAGFRQRGWSVLQWGLFGAVAVWSSLPAVFGLAGLGLAKNLSILRSRSVDDRWFAIVALWLSAFLPLYLLILQPSTVDPYLIGYHADYFIRIPDTDYSWSRLLTLCFTPVKVAFGFTAVAGSVGLFALAIGTWRLDWQQRSLLLGPTLLAFVAAALQQYSLLPRLLLFCLPGLWLTASFGTAYLSSVSNRSVNVAIISAWVLVVGGTNVVRHYWTPLQFSDGRKLAKIAASSTVDVVIDRSAIPVWKYYRAVHPQHCGSEKSYQTGDITQIAPTGSYWQVFDVLTTPGVREKVNHDSRWAIENGFNVSVDSCFRSLVLKCEKL